MKGIFPEREEEDEKGFHSVDVAGWRRKGKEEKREGGMGEGQQIMYVRRLLADPVNRNLQLCACDRESLRSEGMPLYANNVKSWRREGLKVGYSILRTRPEFEDRFEDMNTVAVAAVVATAAIIAATSVVM